MEHREDHHHDLHPHPERQLHLRQGGDAVTQDKEGPAALPQVLHQLTKGSRQRRKIENSIPYVELIKFSLHFWTNWLIYIIIFMMIGKRH